MSIRIIWARLHSDSELLHLVHCHALISQKTFNSMHEIRQIYINQSGLKKGLSPPVPLSIPQPYTYF